MGENLLYIDAIFYIGHLKQTRSSADAILLHVQLPISEGFMVMRGLATVISIQFSTNCGCRDNLNHLVILRPKDRKFELQEMSHIICERKVQVLKNNR